MKKIFITSFLIFTILIAFFNTTFAASTISEDVFIDTLLNMLDNDTNFIKADKEKDFFTLVARNVDVYYNFDNNPEFSMNLVFDNNMTKSECLNKHNVIGVFSDFFGLAVDIHLNESNMSHSSYYTEKISANTETAEIIYPTLGRTVDNFTTPVEYAKNIFKDDIIFSDSLFTVQTKKIQETDKSCTVQATLKIDLQADFSILNNFNNQDNTINNTVNNITAIANNTINSNAIVNKETSILKNHMAFIENSTTSTTNTNTNSFNATKLPQTGNFFDSRDFLYLLIIVCFTGIIVLTLANSRYKNVNKE